MFFVDEYTTYALVWDRDGSAVWMEVYRGGKPRAYMPDLTTKTVRRRDPPRQMLIKKTKRMRDYIDPIPSEGSWSLPPPPKLE
jgi:hypothetical protein